MTNSNKITEPERVRLVGRGHGGDFASDRESVWKPVAKAGSQALAVDTNLRSLEGGIAALLQAPEVEHEKYCRTPVLRDAPGKS